MTCGRKLRISFVKPMCETREQGAVTLHTSHLTPAIGELHREACAIRALIGLESLQSSHRPKKWLVADL
jgi:hypothetical protein